MTAQKLLIQYMLNPLGGIMGRLSPRARDRGFLLGGLGMFLMFFLNGMGLAPSRYLISFAAGCLCMGVMILCALPETLRPLPFDRLLSVCWFGAGLFMLFAGLRYNTDNLSDAIMFLAAYPVAWLVWCQRDIGHIFHLLSKLCILSFLLFLAVSLLFFPITEKQYPGLFTNVNSAAMYLSLVFCCLLAELFQARRFGVRFWGDLALTGVTAAMVFYTNSRTGQLAVLSAFFFGTALYLYTQRRELVKRLLVNVLPVVLSALLFLPTTVYLFQGASAVSKTVSETVSGLLTEKLPSSPTSPESTPSSPHGIQGFLETNEQKTSTEGKNLDKVSTGRLSIWKEFAKHVRLFGTDEPVHYYIESRGQYYSTAHNTPLEYAIHSGLFCGILYVLFNLLAGLKAIWYALRHSEKQYSLLPFLITVAFGVCSMLGSLKTPFTYMISMYYFFVQAPLMIPSAQTPPADNFSAVTK